MRIYITIFILFLAVEARPFGAKPSHIAADSVWLLELQDKFERTDSVFSRAGWVLYTTGISPDIPEKYAREGGEIIFSRYGRKKLDRIQGEFGTPELNRIARLLYIGVLSGQNRFMPTAYRLKSSIMETFINYRAEFEGEKRTGNYFRRLMREESDRERRRRAWYANTLIGSDIAPKLRKLIKKRNRLARECDADDFYEFQLSAMGMTVDNLFMVLGKLDSLTRKPYLQILQKRKIKLGLEAVEPWDFPYISDTLALAFDSYFKKDSLMSVLNRTMTGLGYDMDNLSLQYDLEPRPGKIQSAFCFPIKVPDDIRILANIDDGYSSYRTLFHELGHALHFSYIDQPYYTLRGSPAGCFAEAMASINEAILHQREWLMNYSGVPDSILSPILDLMHDARIAGLRFALVNVYFERELYRTDAENPTELYWDMYERFTFGARHDDVALWALIHHYTDRPVYVHNYILAGLIAAQTFAYLERINGTVIDNKATSDFLINNYFKPGASKDWFELIEDATGEPLNARFFIEDLLGK
jgi:peptidyl-dipeptidase A